MEQYESSLRYHNVVQRIRTASNVHQALVAVQTTYGVDFATYHLALTVADLVDAPYVRTTYPPTWVSHYLLNGHAKIDPVLREGVLRQIPYDWREVDIPIEAHEFLMEARKHGLGANGYSIPIVDKKRRALFSLNSSKPPDQWNKIVNQCRKEWQELDHISTRRLSLRCMANTILYRSSPNERKSVFIGLHWVKMARILPQYSNFPSIPRKPT